MVSLMDFGPVWRIAHTESDKSADETQLVRETKDA